MISQPLYQLVAEHAALLDELTDAGGELTDAMRARLDALNLRFEAKLDACAHMVRNLSAEADKHAEEAKRQGNRAAILSRAAEGLKGYMKFQMGLADLTKVDGIARIQANGPLTVHFSGDAATLPEPYRSTIYALNREAVLQAHKDGQPLPEGLKVERGTHLRILV